MHIPSHLFRDACAVVLQVSNLAFCDPDKNSWPSETMKQIKEESTRLRKVADKLINRKLLILITEGCKTIQNDFLNHQTSKLSEILNLNKRLTNLKYNEDRLSKFAFLHYIFYDSFKIIFSSFIRFLWNISVINKCNFRFQFSRWSPL